MITTTHWIVTMIDEARCMCVWCRHVWKTYANWVFNQDRGFGNREVERFILGMECLDRKLRMFALDQEAELHADIQYADTWTIGSPNARKRILYIECINSCWVYDKIYNLKRWIYMHLFFRKNPSGKPSIRGNPPSGVPGNPLASLAQLSLAQNHIGTLNNE